MGTNFKNKAKRIFSGIMVAGVLAGIVPTVSFAAQSNEYTDPADVWMTSNSRTNELDINATTTYETFFCPVCDMETNMLVYRVPEYTKSGDTALNRGVKFSDGTTIDGTGKGNVDDGTPGVDAKYTGYHYTKAVCQNCGIINANEGTGSYAFGKNVYSLYSCDSDFFLDFDSTTYLPYNSKYHTEIYKAGKYCQYCKGTHAEAEEHREKHNFDETIEAELGNQRFHVTGICDDCGYTKNEYVAAKSVIGSYYGKVDGKAHTVTLSDLSEDGVHTQIRFGTKANECTLTSAPSYTDDGYYPVYYEIDYKYGDVSMTENGVSYVWLLDNGSSENSALSSVHVHDYRFLETVRPTCTELGYDRFQCNECGALMKTNYVPATGHDYDTVVIREASCQQGGLVLHICKDCGSHYTENTSMTDHKYTTNTVAPTCTMNGYTEHVCIDCGFKYITDLTPLAKHDYRPMITPPTCTEHGFVTYVCAVCGDTYTSDYSEPTGHDWDNGHVVTSSTCDSEGVMEYHCKNCHEKMIQAISAKGHKAGPEATCTEPQICLDCGAVVELPKGHNYSETITPPTCETMGFSTFVCEDCGVCYIADYTDPLGHDYAELIVPSTCTEIGYSVFTCSRCGEQYVGNEKAKLPHDYIKTVTEPTCTELGHTDYECKNCGETYSGNYTEAKGHNNSDWIIDVPATIQHDGSRHIECTVCGEVLETEVIPQLSEKDNSDEDGHSVVGNYSVLVTDKDGRPVFNNEISIDANDNITIRLPEGRLISAEDMTIVTVTYTETKQCAEGIRIYISDYAENAATGTTNENGQLTVPNSSSSTSNSNGTVSDGSNTYVVVVTNKDGNLIPNCYVTVGENYSIDLKLPDGTAFNRDNRITVTVVTEHGKPVSGLRVQVIGDSDYIENGYTNINGQVTLPISNTDVTDGNGNAEVGDRDGDKVYDFIVTVSDETELIENALVTLVADDNSILVCLPEGKVIDYYNRTTVKVTRSDGTPVEGWKVTVYNKDGSNIRTEVTDENGIVIVPPLSEAPISNPTATPEADADAPPLPGVDATAAPQATTDPTATAAPTSEPDMGDGSVVENKDYRYRVFVWDNDGVIKSFGLIKLQNDGSVVIELPENKYLDIQNKVHIRVINENDGSPVKGITVNVTDPAGTSASDITNSSGIAIVPVSDSDYTDGNGNAQIRDDEGNTYNITVEDTKTKIENAYVEIKDGKISVKLPDGHTLVTTNQTTVTVLDYDMQPVNGMSVTVIDSTSKSTTKSTDVNGKITVPVKTSSGGGGGSSRGGGGSSSSVTYSITVVDKNGKNVPATKTTTSNGITVTLPKSYGMENNYYTITVKDYTGKTLEGKNVTLRDYDGKNSAEGKTDRNGTVTLPATEHAAYIIGYEDGTFRPEGSMTRAEAAAIFARNIAERKGETITNTKSSFTDVETQLWYNRYISYLEKYDIINGYAAGCMGEQCSEAERPAMRTFRPDAPVTRAEFVAMCTRFYKLFESLPNTSGNRFNDVPSSHWAYSFINSATAKKWLNGYADGSFRPDNSITRAEVVAIVNRVTECRADTEYVNRNLTTVNPFTDMKDKSYWAYYDIIEAANTHMAVIGTDSETWVK